MYKITVEHEKNMNFKVRGHDAEMVIDADGGAIAPLEAMLASLGACAGVYIRKFAWSVKLPLEKFKVTVQGDLTDKAPYAFKKIEILVDLKGAKLDESKRASLLRFIKNCPVHQTLKINPEIDITLIKSKKI